MQDFAEINKMKNQQYYKELFCVFLNKNGEFLNINILVNIK